MTLSTPEKVQSLYLGAGRLAIRAVETTSPPPATDNPEALRADRDRHDAILGRALGRSHGPGRAHRLPGQSRV